MIVEKNSANYQHFQTLIPITNIFKPDNDIDREPNQTNEKTTRSKNDNKPRNDVMILANFCLEI